MPTPETSRSSSYRWPIRILGVLIAAVLVYRFSAEPQAPGGQAAPVQGLRKIAVVPPFALTERSGRTITNRDLAGKIWVADFIYTTCPGPCPLITAGMVKIQESVASDPEVQLVSFTVDPQTDTPAVLAKYADQFGADPNRWWFLTGPEKPLDDLIGKGFLQVVQDNSGQPPQEGQYKVTHSTYLALVDGDGNLRGFYSGLGEDGRADLLRDIKVLEKENQ
ncbi:MAG TPA: SCO family protein [Candidatus Methylacidiphilales bacterium]|jgi:protein SCO1/2|nr:SCO family protein [Candidatus Methylacidiphilales bacterium]